jgi:hypothetical protein
MSSYSGTYFLYGSEVEGKVPHGVNLEGDQVPESIKPNGIPGGIEMYSQGRYFTVTGQHLPETPDTIASPNGTLTSLYQQTQNRKQQKQKIDVPEADRVKAALAALNSSRWDNYRQWVALGLMLKHWDGAGARDLWEQHTRKSSKYQDGDCDKWDTFSPDGRVRIATLFHWANEDSPDWWKVLYQRNGTAPEQARDDQAASGAAAPEGDGDPRCTIQVNDLDIPHVARQAWDALITQQQRAPMLFRRGGVLVELADDDDGRRVIVKTDNARLRGTLARVCVFWRERKTRQGTETYIVNPPETVVNDCQVYIDSRVQVLDRVVHTPVFGRAGELLAGPGYHGAARIYHDLHPGIPAIPDATPTAEQVAQARALMMDDLLGDFPFVDEADKAHAVALLLLPFVRAMIPGPTPLHMIEAPTMGSGKGLLADVITTISTGAPPAPMAEAGDDDEWRKRITSTLLGAPSHVMLDNLNRTLDSGSLAAALTATMWEDRLLGMSQNVRLPVSVVWLATANNPNMTSEIARRTVRIRIDPRIDRPWLRTGFKHDNLRQWAGENRGALVAACITLIRAGLPSGTPGRTLGTFEAWSDVMGRILPGVGIPGFLDNLVKLYDAADTEGQRWRTVVDVWWEAHGSNRVKAADVYQAITEAGVELDLRGRTEKAQQSAFGKALARMKDRVINGYQIVQAGTYRRVAEWRLMRTDGSDNDPETANMFTGDDNSVQVDVGCVGFSPVCVEKEQSRARARTPEASEKPTQPTQPAHTYTPDYATGEHDAAPELPDGWRLVRCDHKGNVTRFGEYWRAGHNDGTMTEPTQYRDSAVRQACAWRE